MRLGFLRSITLSLFLYLFLLAFFSCMPMETKKKPIHSKGENLISLASYIEIIYSSQRLERNIVNQINPERPYFAEKDYFWFSSHLDSTVLMELGKFSRMVLFDIYVDYRLLNNFLFVFTEYNTDSIIGYVRQNHDVGQPDKERYYYILREKIRKIAGEGLCDIYGFRNDTLAFKSTYPPVF